MTTARDLDAALRTLDPTTADTTAGGSRAAADLERILASATPAPPQHDGTPRRPRTGRRIAVAGGLVAAATTSLLVLPPVLGENSAFATWTAYPSGLSPEQSATVADECRDLLTGKGPDTLPAQDADVAITERRGRWTQVVLTDPGGFFGSCLTTDPPDENSSGGAGDGGRVPGPRELTVLISGTATVEAGEVSELTGRAGEDVDTVTYASEDHGDVVATVSSGAWALWFPGDELEDVADPDGIRVRVGYQDGSTATVTLLGECHRGLTEETC
ncbi:hypothetical protein WDZ17_14360 [Pseudokineococcus basanitobsidens]|uniref:Uncharacterized protein n=1 Tax=Pseudokineococcus basanitobsidens TaxID=1926649 RepID=A0ABU8RMZ7_9ACTN